LGRRYNKGMKKIHSLYELKIKAMEDKAYEKLAIDTAYNLGGSNINDLNDAIRWLNINAMETSEEGVVEEVNFMGAIQ
jgi:BRCT domain type II-containing protein